MEPKCIKLIEHASAKGVQITLFLEVELHRLLTVVRYH